MHLSASSVEALEREFLAARGIDPAALNESTLNVRLAECLMIDMDAENTATRGILFDMHRHSAELQQRIRTGGIAVGAATSPMT